MAKLFLAEPNPKFLVNLHHLTNILNASLMQQHRKQNTNGGYTIPDTSFWINLSFTNNICPHNTGHLKISHETSWFRRLTMWCTISHCDLMFRLWHPIPCVSQCQLRNHQHPQQWRITRQYIKHRMQNTVITKSSHHS